MTQYSDACFLKCDHTISEALCCEITAELNLPSSALAVAADAIVSISISRLPPTSPTQILTRSSHHQITNSLRRGERKNNMAGIIAQLTRSARERGNKVIR